MRYVTRLYRVVFARPFFRRFNSYLFHLALHGLGVLNYENDSVSGERHLVEILLPKVISKPSPVLFDVGANVGRYSAMLLRRFPAALIHAFEPHPTNYARLVANEFPAQQVKCNNIAIGATKGFLTLYDRADNDGSELASVHEAAITEFHDQASVAIEVAVETLDDIALREGITYIDFLKIDTEGHELAVLSGASRLLREKKIGHIQFEFNALHVYSRVFFRDFRIILYNYDLYRLLPAGLLALDSNVTMTEIFAFQNILAIPKGS